MSGTLILTGSPGAGKTSVVDELATLLEIDDVPFGALETETLSRGWPWLSISEWIPQLAAVISLQRQAGRDTFLIVATTETEEQLQAVIDAMAEGPVLVVCFSVPGDEAARRVAEREPDSWPGKLGLVEHARKLADEIPLLPGVDVVIGTDGRRAVDVAAELKELLAARGLIGAADRRPPSRRLR
jgi:adenylate kinase family enzyme